MRWFDKQGFFPFPSIVNSLIHIIKTAEAEKCYFFFQLFKFAVLQQPLQYYNAIDVPIIPEAVLFSYLIDIIREKHKAKEAGKARDASSVWGIVSNW